MGALDAASNATAAFSLPPICSPSLVGTVAHHAWLELGPPLGPPLGTPSAASNPTALLLFP